MNFKKVPFVCFCLGASLAAVSAQEPGPGERGPRGGFSFMRMHPVLAALDSDGDGTIAATELAAAPNVLSKLDADHDGKLAPEEMRPRFGPGGRGGRGRGPGGPGGEPGGGRPAETEPPSSADLVKNLLSFDRNGDGNLTKEEVPERMQGLFARGDADKNGTLSSAELNKMAETQSRRANEERPGGGPPPDPILRALDTNQDGAVSSAEIAKSPAALKSLDKNGDGALTEEEVRPFGRGGPEGGRGRERENH